MRLLFALTALYLCIATLKPVFGACGTFRADGKCGTNTASNKACDWGYCCSEYGWCGNTTEYCNDKSQIKCLVTTAPTTAAPTLAPNTVAPTTAAPTTAAPTTAAPTTAAPTTAAPTTAAPTTAAPTTAPTACAASYSTDDRCGPDYGYKPCPSSQCCSQYGWCGTTTSYCTNSAETWKVCTSTTAAPSSTTAAPTTAAPTLEPSVYKYMATQSCGKNKIALTFDDGPNVATTSLLAALANQGVPATVFVNAINYEDLSDSLKCQALQNAANAGIEIQSHSYRHLNFLGLSNDDIKTDLTALAAFVTGCSITTPIKFFRPPYGDLTQAQAEYIYKEFGYVIAMWNGMTADTDNSNINAIELSLDNTMPVPSSVDGTGSGALVLAHDYASLGKYEEYIGYLKTKWYGYTFVTMSECWSSCTSFKSGISGKICVEDSGASATLLSDWT